MKTDPADDPLTALLRQLPEAPPDAAFARRVQHLASLTPQQPRLQPRLWWRSLGLAESGGLVAGTIAGLVLAVALQSPAGYPWTRLPGSSTTPSSAPTGEINGVTLAQLIAPPPYWQVVSVAPAATPDSQETRP